MIRNIRISELLLAGTPRRTPSPVTECRLSGLVIRQTQYTFLINDTANKKQRREQVGGRAPPSSQQTLVQQQKQPQYQELEGRNLDGRGSRSFTAPRANMLGI